MYELIAGAERIGSADLYAEYERQEQTPKVKPTRRLYLQRLEQYDLIEKHGDGWGTEYTVCRG
ncbi:hypothetical protein [Halorientalis brevis]|uniref:hypothetical protein n=1 Tax=Halorientalis brevis TaxID=1126241 RepID=UPI0036D2AE77